MIAGVLAAGSACTMKEQEAPPLAGPSELDQSIVISVSPDTLPQDGASQSIVTITARDAAAQPIRNLTMRTEMRVNGSPVDFGSLSARNVTTGSDGRATLIYTAPPSPQLSTVLSTFVDIHATPIGNDYNNAVTRSAAIRVVTQGTVAPPSNLVASFTVFPTSPGQRQTVLFDASGSSGSIVEYRWNFGDGEHGSGVTEAHDYADPGTYVATLTVVDGFGRTASRSQSITVAAGTDMTPSFVFSPSAPTVGGLVSFNASASKAGSTGRIVSYTWDFGDGSARVATSDTIVTKRFGAPGTFNVTLVVTDEAGRTAVVTNPVTIAP